MARMIPAIAPADNMGVLLANSRAGLWREGKHSGLEPSRGETSPTDVRQTVIRSTSDIYQIQHE